MPIVHSLLRIRGRGASAGFPSGFPFLIHARRSALSDGERERSLAQGEGCPAGGSEANQGGSALRNDLPDHAGIFLSLVIVLQSKRSDSAFAVAFHAVGFQNAGDPVMEVHTCCSGSFPGRRPTASRSPQGGGLDRLAGQVGVKRFLEILSSWLIKLVADAVLIVDRSAVEDGSGGIQNEGVVVVRAPRARVRDSSSSKMTGPRILALRPSCANLLWPP